MKLGRLCAFAMALVVCALVVCANGLARAEDHYPSRVITIVVPLTPGTAIDIQARLYADALAKRYGYQVIVVNKAGAGTAIGAETVANANPDGYTVLLTNSAHAMLSTMNKNLTFDPIADFAPIELIAKAPSVVAVAPSLGVHNLQEFIALAKAKPNTVNYGSAGIGTATHIAGAYFALQTGIQLVHVPYTVSQTILTDLLAGHIQVTFSPESFMLPLLQDGKLLPLAVSDKEPVTEPIKIPTALSQGVDYVSATWYGFLAPAKTPREVQETLHAAIVEVGKDPELQARIRLMGFTPVDIGLGDFDAYLHGEMKRLAPLLATIGQSN
jgi:tripartite-type tricarboxylate transporter receptor subunit TctC